MMDVTARPAPGREVDAATFLDITDAAVVDVSWRPDGWLRVEFARDLTEVEAGRVWGRMRSTDARDEARRAALWDAAQKGATNLAQMHVAYALDQPMPAPLLSTTQSTATNAGMTASPGPT
jgi:hypothetical protein